MYKPSAVEMMLRPLERLVLLVSKYLPVFTYFVQLAFCLSPDTPHLYLVVLLLLFFRPCSLSPLGLGDNELVAACHCLSNKCQHNAHQQSHWTNTWNAKRLRHTDTDTNTRRVRARNATRSKRILFRRGECIFIKFKCHDIWSLCLFDYCSLWEECILESSWEFPCNRHYWTAWKNYANDGPA